MNEYRNMTEEVLAMAPMQCLIGFYLHPDSRLVERLIENDNYPYAFNLIDNWYYFPSNITKNIIARRWRDAMATAESKDVLVEMEREFG